VTHGTEARLFPAVVDRFDGEPAGARLGGGCACRLRRRGLHAGNPLGGTTRRQRACRRGACDGETTQAAHWTAAPPADVVAVDLSGAAIMVDAVAVVLKCSEPSG